MDRKWRAAELAPRCRRSADTLGDISRELADLHLDSLSQKAFDLELALGELAVDLLELAQNTPASSKQPRLPF